MQIVRTLPQTVIVALSGGVDSIALLHFLRLNTKRTVIAAHFVHDNEYAERELKLVKTVCSENNINLITKVQSTPLPPKTSKEAHWRTCRYEFFKSLPYTVCTGHTLDDATEWYVFTALNGEGHYMEYKNENVVKPFITTKKSELIKFAIDNNHTWLEDESNTDVDFAARNRIRHNILPEALKVNPGLHNMVRSRILAKLDKGAASLWYR